MTRHQIAIAVRGLADRIDPTPKTSPTINIVNISTPEDRCAKAMADQLGRAMRMRGVG